MPHQNPLFVFFGNNSFENRGCEAIVRSTVAIVQEYFGKCRFINALMFPADPSSFGYLDYDVRHVLPPVIQKKHFGQKGWLSYRFGKITNRRCKETFEPYVSSAIATLALGGDNYSLDYGNPKRYFKANNVVLSKNKPLVLWGASIGPFSRDPDIESFAAQELKKVSLICARESETVKYLKTLGIQSNVRQVADPAFILEPTPVENLMGGVDIANQSYIGMNFSPLMSSYWSQEQSWGQCVAECIKACLERFNLPILLIPHVIWPDNDDHAFMQKIINDFDLPDNKVKLIDRHYNAQQLKWIIAQMELFVGCRTHATIASLSSAVPTLSIGYSLKSQGINKDIFGSTDWLIPVEKICPEILIEKTNIALHTASKTRDYLIEFMPEYKNKAWMAGNHLREILSHSS